MPIVNLAGKGFEPLAKLPTNCPESRDCPLSFRSWACSAAWALKRCGPRRWFAVARSLPHEKLVCSICPDVEFGLHCLRGVAPSGAFGFWKGAPAKKKCQECFLHDGKQKE